MTFLNARTFIDAVTDDPFWASHLKSPTSITEFVLLENHPIAALSPLLHFCGYSQTHTTPGGYPVAKGMSACFLNCPQLTHAQGVFHRTVDFSKSAVRRISELLLTGTDPLNRAAIFNDCLELHNVEATFPGYVSFQGSGLKKANLTITASSTHGWAADLSMCQALQELTGTFHGAINLMFSPIRDLSHVKIFTPPDKKKLNVLHCEKLTRLPPEISPEHIIATETLIKKIFAQTHNGF